MRPYLHVTHTPETGALVVLTNRDGERVSTFEQAAWEAHRILARPVRYCPGRRGAVRLVDFPGALVTGKILWQPQAMGPFAVLQATLWLPKR